MTKLCKAMLVDYLDALQTTASPRGGPMGNVSAASNAVGITRQRANTWLRKSKADEAAGDTLASPFFFEYGGQLAFFHWHAKEVVRVLVQEVHHAVLLAARDGYTMPSMFQGRRVPQTDYDLLALGFPEAECIKRDPVTNEVLFEQTWVPPSAERQLAVLSSYMRKFAKRIDHQVMVNTGGARMAERPKELDAPQPSLPVLEIIEPPAEDATFTEETAPELAPDAVPVAAARWPEGTRSPLQEDLISQARSRGLVR